MPHIASRADAEKLDAACAKGIELQLSGRLDLAGEIYGAILQSAPDHAAANYCLGMLHVHSQRPGEGLQYLKAALQSRLDVVDYWLGYLEALTLAGQTEAARNILALGQQQGIAGKAVDEFAERLRSLVVHESPAGKHAQPPPSHNPGCSDEGISQLLITTIAANTHEIQLARCSNFSVSPDLNLSAFENTIDRLRDEGRFNEILEIMLNSVRSFKLQPELIGNKIYTPYFDGVLESIALDIEPVIPNDKKLVNVVIASEIYESGGHTKVIAELLDTLENPMLVITDIYDRFSDTDLFSRIAATFPRCPVFVLAKERYLDKAIRLAGFINVCAKNVFLVSHHDDPVAILACQNTLDTSYYFVHHADHNTSLGCHVKHFHHIDLFEDIAKLCAADLKRSVHVLPIHANDMSQQAFHYPIERFSTVSAGTSNKFTFSGAVNFAELIVSAIRTCGGKHYHFGELTDEQVQLIHAHLTRAEIAKESFVYMGNVPSLWTGLLAIDAHIYVGSFPMRGGKGEIEAQGASFPLLIYRDPNDPKYLNVAHCNALTKTWHDQSGFCEGLRSIMLTHQACSSESRHFYLKHHTKTRYVSALSSLIQSL